MTREITPHDHFYGIRFALKANGHIGIGGGLNPIRNQGLSGSKIHCGDLVQNPSLVGNGLGEYNIKGRNAISGYHHHTVTEVINIANLALVKSGLSFEFEVSL